MKRLSLLCIIFVILFSSCMGFGRKYTVAIDPSFYPANLGGQANNVYGFTVDLIEEVAKLEGLRISYVNVGSQSTLSALQRNVFDAFITPKSNVVVESSIYSISNNYFPTGPVIVVPIKSKLKSLDQMEGKIAGVTGFSDAEKLIQQYPMIYIYSYTTPAFVMEALKDNLVDFAFLDVMVARAFVANLYRGTFEISSKPVGDQGLYLATMLNEHPELIDAFNRGVKRAKRKGIYKKLMIKWNLYH